MVKKRRRTPGRLDREIVRALGKKSKLWQVPEKKPHPRSKEAEKRATTAAAKREEVCRFCAQKLHWSDAHFECGDEGAGACSFWVVIGDYDRAGRPKDVEGWLDGWIQREMGTSWSDRGWDRSKYARAIRDYFKLPAPAPAPRATERAHASVKISPADLSAEDWRKLSLAAEHEAALARRAGATAAASRWGTLARASSTTPLTDNDWYWFSRAATRQAREARRAGDTVAATAWDALAEKAEASA